MPEEEEFENAQPALAAGTSLEVNSNGSLDDAAPQLLDSNASNNEISAMAAEFPSVRNLIRKFDSLGSGSQPTKTKSPLMLQPRKHEQVELSKTEVTANTTAISVNVEPAAVPKQLPNPDGGDSVSGSDDLPGAKDSGGLASNNSPPLNSDLAADNIEAANSDLALKEIASQKEGESVAVSKIKHCEADLDSACAEANLIDAATMETNQEHQVSDCEEEEQMYSASAGYTFDDCKAAVANADGRVASPGPGQSVLVSVEDLPQSVETKVEANTLTESAEEAVELDNVPPALAAEGAESDEEVATDAAEEYEAVETVGDTGTADNFEEAKEALEDATIERAAEEPQQPVARVEEASTLMSVSASGISSTSASASASAVASISASSEEDATKRPLKACAKLVRGERKPSKQQQQRRLRGAGGSAAPATPDFMTASSPKKRRLLLSNCARTLKNKVLDASRSMMSLVSRADEPVGRTRSHASASLASASASASASPPVVAIKTPVSSVTISIASHSEFSTSGPPASAPGSAPTSAPDSALDSAPDSAPACAFDSESPAESPAASTAASAVVVAGTSLVSPKSPQPNLLFDSDEEPLLEPDLPELQENNSALHRCTDDESERAVGRRKFSGGRTKEISSASSDGQNQSATLCWQVKDAASAARMSFTFVASQIAAAAPPPPSSTSRTAPGTGLAVPAGPPQTGPVDVEKISEAAAYFTLGSEDVADEDTVDCLADNSAVARVASIQGGPRFCRLVRLREIS